MRASMAAAHKVVGGGDGVDVAGQVQVEILHGDDLRIPASRGPALDAEGRPLRGLADGSNDLFPQVRAEGLAEADGGGGFPFPERGGRDRGDVHILPVRAVLEAVIHFQLDLGLVRPVQLKIFGFQSQFRGYLGDRLDLASLSDLDVGWYRPQRLDPRRVEGRNASLPFRRGFIFADTRGFRLIVGLSAIFPPWGI